MSTVTCFENNLDENAERLANPGLASRLWRAVDGVSARINQYVYAAGKGYRGPGVYVGVAGIALMWLKLADAANRGEKPPPEAMNLYLSDENALLANALKLVCSGEGEIDRLKRHGRVTFLEGASGLHAIKASVLHRLGRHDEAAKSVRALEEMAAEVLGMDSGECEVLYGRCGYLYSLLFIESRLGVGTVDSGIFTKLVSQVLEEGMGFASDRGKSDEFGLMYAWHGKSYLGACHGLAGILYVLNLCPHQVRQLYPNGEARDALFRATRFLLKRALPSWNFPSSLGNDSDRLVQFCHGAPGVVLFFSQLLGATENTVLHSHGDFPALKEACARGADLGAQCVWERGLLTKGVGLCHGISGNGYAFLSLYRQTGDERYLKRARAFADFTAENWHALEEVPDNEASLYEGLAGAVCFWVDAMYPQHSSFPGFEI
ncbi:hypothetical protein BSKO_12827 [Bryopsis sp. KO-2023]|nr:hypothetical protein BSKO_12827 [Bryopsis sp. KO-2023]